MTRACPACEGKGKTFVYEENVGVVQGTCGTCLGDGKARPHPSQFHLGPLLHYQGQMQCAVRAYTVSGMMAVPCEEGVVYVTRAAAMRFFGLVEITPPLPVPEQTTNNVFIAQVADASGEMVALEGTWTTEHPPCANLAPPRIDLRQVPGEVLGHGYPDWPGELVTFVERIAYQRGIAHARAVDASLKGK